MRGGFAPWWGDTDTLTEVDWSGYISSLVKWDLTGLARWDRRPSLDIGTHSWIVIITGLSGTPANCSIFLFCVMLLIPRSSGMKVYSLQSSLLRDMLYVSSIPGVRSKFAFGKWSRKSEILSRSADKKKKWHRTTFTLGYSSGTFYISPCSSSLVG